MGELDAPACNAADTRYAVSILVDFIYAPSKAEARAEVIQSLVEDASLIVVRDGDVLPWETEDGMLRVIEEQARKALEHWLNGGDVDADFLLIDKHLEDLDKIRSGDRA